ncbi:MAG: CTP synthase [Patescibacteria group bacterium]|nr:CTP synthase [Patescibacteria group bacterium]
MKKTKTKFIFVMGGVLSGLGKGIAVSSLSRLLKSKSYRVSAMKIDPYVNVDAGTMNPTEHGEVFVTQDGLETDQDIGNYERFLSQELNKDNYMTTGSVYRSVIQKERNLEFNGKCVEVVPHIPNEVIRRIKKLARKSKADFIIIEIGGTVGEYQNLLFLEAARMMNLKNPGQVQYILVSYLPIPSKIGEMKTKPTQYAVRTLNSAGIQPDFLFCRAEKPLDKPRREKLSTNCNVDPENIISAVDVDNIYEIPLNFSKQKVARKILKNFGLRPRKGDLKEWQKIINKSKRARKKVKIGIVGKYFGVGDFILADSYISVIESLKHAAWANTAKLELTWINAEEFERKPQNVKKLKNYDGIVVPQGWGSRGSEGKIKTIKYVRENFIPYLGLCYGMQMAVIEFARNVLKLKKANSSEIDPKTPHPIIHVMPDQEKYLAKKQYGGTIRLGNWPCKIIKGTRLAKAYKNKRKIQERHRHRYEFNTAYRAKMEKKGLTIAGTSPDGKLVEAVEISDHPFFIGVQFHPEYKSQFLNPHPLFVEFLQVCKK